MKKQLISTVIGAILLVPAMANAADYKIDTQGAHASLQFKVNHLCYSFVTCRFNDFSGDFIYDANKFNDTKVKVTINKNSVH